MANIVSCNVTSFLTRKETGKFKIASKQRCADINDMVENFIISLNDFIMSKTNFEEDGRRRALMSNIKANPLDNTLKVCDLRRVIVPETLPASLKTLKNIIKGSTQDQLMRIIGRVNNTNKERENVAVAIATIDDRLVSASWDNTLKVRDLNEVTIDKKTLKNIIKGSTQDQLMRIIGRVLQLPNNTNKERENVAVAIATISIIDVRSKALKIDMIIKLINLANQGNTQFGLECIAKAIRNIAVSTEGRKALIAKGAITTLKHLAKKSNTPKVRQYIAQAIANIAASVEGSRALISNIQANPDDNILKFLTTMAKKINTPEGRQSIAEAIGNMSISPLGRRALFLHIQANPDDNILKFLTTMAKKTKTPLERDCFARVIVNIAATYLGRAALIDSGGIDALNYLAKTNTPEVLQSIAKVIANMSISPSGRRALISHIQANPDDNILKFLTTMAKKTKTLLERECIAVAITNIAMSVAGTTALISNIQANPDDNILKSLTTMATQNNTALVIEQLAFVINKLTMPRRKQKQDPCCIVS